MINEKPMKLIFDAVMILANCSEYRVTINGRVILSADDCKDAAASIISLMAENEFRKTMSEGSES